MVRNMKVAARAALGFGVIALLSSTGRCGVPAQAVSALQASLELEQARGSETVAQASGEVLERIARAISGINDRNLVIASASEEQVQVVDRNLAAIRDLSMQSAAGANQTNAASQELSRLAVGLNGLVTRFRV